MRMRKEQNSIDPSRGSGDRLVPAVLIRAGLLTSNTTWSAVLATQAVKEFYGDDPSLYTLRVDEWSQSNPVVHIFEGATGDIVRSKELEVTYLSGASIFEVTSPNSFQDIFTGKVHQIELPEGQELNQVFTTDDGSVFAVVYQYSPQSRDANYPQLIDVKTGRLVFSQFEEHRYQAQSIEQAMTGEFFGVARDYSDSFSSEDPFKTTISIYSHSSGGVVEYEIPETYPAYVILGVTQDYIVYKTSTQIRKLDRETQTDHILLDEADLEEGTVLSSVSVFLDENTLIVPFRDGDEKWGNFMVVDVNSGDVKETFEIPDNLTFGLEGDGDGTAIITGFDSQTRQSEWIAVEQTEDGIELISLDGSEIDSKLNMPNTFYSTSALELHSEDNLHLEMQVGFNAFLWVLIVLLFYSNLKKSK